MGGGHLGISSQCMLIPMIFELETWLRIVIKRLEVDSMRLVDARDVAISLPCPPLRSFNRVVKRS